MERLSALIPTILQRPELVARFEDLQTLPRNPPPMGVDFTRIIQEQVTEWAAVARQFNITAA